MITSLRSTSSELVLKLFLHRSRYSSNEASMVGQSRMFSQQAAMDPTSNTTNGLTQNFHQLSISSSSPPEEVLRTDIEAIFNAISVDATDFKINQARNTTEIQVTSVIFAVPDGPHLTVRLSEDLLRETYEQMHMVRLSEINDYHTLEFRVVHSSKGSATTMENHVALLGALYEQHSIEFREAANQSPITFLKDGHEEGSANDDTPSSSFKFFRGLFEIAEARRPTFMAYMLDVAPGSVMLASPGMGLPPVERDFGPHTLVKTLFSEGNSRLEFLIHPSAASEMQKAIRERLSQEAHAGMMLRPRTRRVE